MQVIEHLRSALVVLHVAGVIVGGYVLCGCVTALVSAVMVLFGGHTRGEAVLWSTMLSFLLYLALLIWGVSASPKRAFTWFTVATILSWGSLLCLLPALSTHIRDGAL